MSTIQLSDRSTPECPAFTVPRPSSISWYGLCAASFFLAEANGVTMPFVNTYLVDRGWSYESIGMIAALGGLVSWLMNVPIGLLIDAAHRHHKNFLVGASLVVGICTGLLPVFASSAASVAVLLVIASLGRPFFGPLTNALTFDLVGTAGLDQALGFKQCWNHVGNIAAALSAMVLVYCYSVDAVFFSVAAVSILAAGSVIFIRSVDLVDRRVKPLVTTNAPPLGGLGEFLRHRQVGPLMIATILFHLANAPVMPLVAQKVRYVGGTNVQVAGVVLVAQSVMIPVAILAGYLGPRVGYKRLLSVGFLVLPIRIALYAFANDANALVALQALDGLGAGVFDVTSISICAAVTRQRGQFNGLVGILGTAIGIGGVAGPFLSGMLVQYLGFAAAFGAFAVIAAVAALVFIVRMPSDPIGGIENCTPA